MLPLRVAKLIDQKDAIKEIKERLSHLGYVQIEKEIGGTTYWSKRKFFHHKIRVSNHPWSNGIKRSDVVTSIEVTGPTILSDIQYRVRTADKAFIRESTAKRVTLG